METGLMDELTAQFTGFGTEVINRGETDGCEMLMRKMLRTMREKNVTLLEQEERSGPVCVSLFLCAFWRIASEKVDGNGKI